MLIRRPHDLKSSEITPESLYLDRRAWIAAAGAFALSAFASRAGAEDPKAVGKPFGLQPNDTPTPWQDVTTYNNFYEFGTDKSDPAANAGNFKTSPWTITVDGLAGKPGKYLLEDFIKPSTVEDRIYRHRCVEAWSMVIPVARNPAGRRDQASRAHGRPRSTFSFTTLMDPKQMPGQQLGVLDGPTPKACVWMKPCIR